MGCGTSRMAAVNTNATEKMMQTMMQNVTQMQQEQLARQQQIMQDDPECKELMDRLMAINQKIIAAFQSGDQAALARAQSENLELQKHPKYMKLMMPTIPQTKTFLTRRRTDVKHNQSAFTTNSESMNMFAFSGGSGIGSTPSGFGYGGGGGEASMPSSGFDYGGGGSSMFTEMASTME